MDAQTLRHRNPTQKYKTRGHLGARRLRFENRYILSLEPIPGVVANQILCARHVSCCRTDAIHSRTQQI
jgi:hypothetical protein